MNHRLRYQQIALLLIANVVLATGCATTKPPPVSGFLVDYQGFKADAADTSLLWWEQDRFNWADYRGVIIDPINIDYHPRAQNREISPYEFKELTDSFRQSVIAELGDEYKVLDEPATDVLRIRGAITDVMPSNVALNVVSNLLLFIPVDMGGAAIEVEFLDSVTGERLAAGVDQKMGTPLDGFTGFKRLGHAKSAFRGWARNLRVALETNP